MNERTHFFIKVYLSHFILERVDIGCMWEVRWRRRQTATYWPKVLLIIPALLPHLGWGCSTMGHWGLAALSLQADSHAGILSPNWLQLQLELTQAVCGTWLYNCLTVVYWPLTRPNMPFQRRGSCMFHWRGRAWLTIWDKVKSHGTVRLMHRKRVTCELHDSYFRSMTIKHAIPRTVEVTHSDGQLWGDIEWAIELLYNSVKTGSQLDLETRPVGDKVW